MTFPDYLGYIYGTNIRQNLSVFLAVSVDTYLVYVWGRILPQCLCCVGSVGIFNNAGYKRELQFHKGQTMPLKCIVYIGKGTLQQPRQNIPFAQNLVLQLVSLDLDKGRNVTGG